MIKPTVFALVVLIASSFVAAETPPSSAQYVAKAIKEMQNGIDERKQRPVYDAFIALMNKLLDESAGDKTWSDKTGNCRLSWIDHMLRHPVESIAEAEAFTRELHLAAQESGIHNVLEITAAKLDLKLPKQPVVERSKDGIAVIEAAMLEATQFSRAAFAPLSDAERSELFQSLYKTTTGDAIVGAILPDKKAARPTFDLLEKVDRASFVRAAMALEPLLDTKQAAALADSVKGKTVQINGIEGNIRAVISTPSGKIIVGGDGKNVYHLDELSNVCMVIDPGGDDTYEEGTLSADRPVLVIIDLAGNDTYHGTKPGIQGGAIGGVSLLIDAAGDDTYDAQDVAQGACLAGVGILIDMAGNDSYRGLRRVQGSAIAGVGLLIDRDGNDKYHGALFAQGVGGPLGFGLLDDLKGNDTYYAGGLYLDSYDDSPGYDGWSQGCGYGPRGVANGGIGVLLDGAGDDTYECDYFSHAAGYWFGAGFARDFAGNDKRFGSTLLAYDGKPRKEARFLRYGIAFGCHFALGFLFDDAGDDFYGGNMGGHGFAWDLSVGVLCDFAGNDTYDAQGGVVQGTAFQAGLAVLLDVAGDDHYAAQGPSQGFAQAKVEYHKELTDGGNFGFLIDWGGTDTYSCGAANNTITQRECPGGFLIDRAAPPD